MGHTTKSQRQVVDGLISELSSFAKALRIEDREVFLDLLDKPLKHLGSISYASSLHTWAFFVLTVCLEQQKEIDAMRRELSGQ